MKTEVQEEEEAREEIKVGSKEGPTAAQPVQAQAPAQVALAAGSSSSINPSASLDISMEKHAELQQMLSQLSPEQLQERAALAQLHAKFNQYWSLVCEQFQLAPRLPRRRSEHSTKGNRQLQFSISYVYC